MTRRRRPVPWAAALALLAVPAVAQEVRPFAGLDLRYGGDLLLRSDTLRTLGPFNGRDALTNSFAQGDLNAFVTADRVTVKTQLSLRQVQAPEGDAVLHGQGAYVAQLQALLDLDPLELHAGKFFIRFGRANAGMPGLFSTDFTADYEMPERIGFGLRHAVTGFGTHAIGLDVFTLDGTALSNSGITRPRFGQRGTLRPSRIRGEHGGPGNDGQLDNAALTLTGQDMPGLPGLGYEIGWRRQPGRAAMGERTEQGGVASLAWSATLATGWRLSPMAEHARMENFAGGTQPVSWTSLAVELTMPAGTSAALHGTERRVGGSGRLLRGRDRLFGASVAQELGDGLPAALTTTLPLLREMAAEFGWKAERARDAATGTRRGLQALGAELRWRRRF